MTVRPQVEHTVTDEQMDHRWGTVPFEAPRYGAVLSPDEVDAVLSALIAAEVWMERVNNGVAMKAVLGQSIVKTAQRRTYP